MVRTVKNHHQEEEEDDEDFISRTTDGSSQKDGGRNDQKASSHRSKHSETEQRRRSKINERFQILRELIPQNDQKRDRASFLLEVIQYIQFLQEKLQVYEGTYQGWSPEPTKLMPWRGTDSFADQSQALKNGCVDEGNNIIVTPTLLTNAHNLVEPDLSAFKSTDQGASRPLPVDQNTFEAEPTHNPHTSFSDVDLLTPQLQPQPWNARPLSSEGASPSQLEELKIQREEASISDTYSKGLLSNLTQALGSCGVDLSQASISVQFDIRKGTTTSTSFGIKDHDLISGGSEATAHSSGVRTRDDGYNESHKRPRTEQNQ